MAEPIVGVEKFKHALRSNVTDRYETIETTFSKEVVTEDVVVVALTHRATGSNVWHGFDVAGKPVTWTALTYFRFNPEGKVVEETVERNELFAIGSQKVVIGVSGGLDSTHALIVAAKAMDLLGLPRTNILAYTMPGFATGTQSKRQAWDLMRALEVSSQEPDIRPAATQMLKDMGHPFGKGEPVYDITFENVQAGLRTDYLFRLANHHGGIVIGTGDLSELALGWCTYGVGDQMAHTM